MMWEILLWIAGIALLVFGFFMIGISYCKQWVARLKWDPSMVALGLALVSIGFFFLDKVVD